MNYPTMEEVEKADREQLCRWWRFLHSPGWMAIGERDFLDRLEKEAQVMMRIGNLLKELGGFTPEISKKIGWNENEI